MKAFVINMKKSTHRRDATRKMLTQLNIEHEFIDAVDGRLLSEEAFIASVEQPDEFTPSQAGCALSHLDAYKKILAGDDEYGLVLEDDVLITEQDCKLLLEKLEPTLNNDDIILLTYYWCRDGFLKLKTDSSFDIKNTTYNVCTPHEIHGIGRAAAYIISKKCCKQMIDFNFPLHAQADSWVVFNRNKAIGDIKCVYPMPITENDQFGSEIGYTKGTLQNIAKKLVTLAVNVNLPIITPMIKNKRKRFAQTYKNIKMSK